MSRLTDEQRIKVIKWWHQKLSIIQIQRMRKTITRIIHKAPTRPDVVMLLILLTVSIVHTFFYHFYC